MQNDVKRPSRSLASVWTMLCAGLLCAVPAAAQAQPRILNNAVVHGPTAFDVSPPLSQMLTLTPSQQGERLMHPPLRPKPDKLKGAAPQRLPTLSGTPSTSLGSPIAATIGLNFDGVGNTSVNNCPNVSGQIAAPPDTNAAVGDTEVVQWVNTCYAVFDKATGTLIAGPFAGNKFWAGFGGACETRNDGDVIIQWDKANHVWVASQNTLAPPYETCVAVSRTADATGSYNRYAFSQPDFPDYPKWGLTPNAYYQTQNVFNLASLYFEGVNVCAYQAVLMRNANPYAEQVCILDNSNGTLFDDSMLPADNDSVDGHGIKPEVLLGSIDNFLSGDKIYEYVFAVDFEKPANSTLAGVDGSMPLSVPAFNLAICALAGNLTTFCIPQPGVPYTLDTLGDRLMYRLARFLDSHHVQHFLVTHTVNNSTGVAARWYEFRAPNNSTALSLYQSGQTPDDGEYRWMGSVAYDRLGDIALGYSRSSATPGDYPSLYLSGQTAGEPAGTTDGETLIFAGSGSQTDTLDRWGDYSSMALDGDDLCSFWYTTEYYPATGAFTWNTRIAGQIKFPGCQ